jgi:methylenetetrahydrofolate reductase (NADPH)
MAEKSRLQRMLEAGVFTLTTEIGPPMSVDGRGVRSKARLLADVADAVNITDNQAAVVRMSSIAAGILVREEGVEPVVQMTCRDRNRIALQSDLLGAWALGARNLLCLSGDHPTLGNHRAAKNVYDIDSIQLLQAVRRLQEEGVFISGNKCKNPPGFFLGATANPFADPEELQLIRLRKKIEAGARFIQTQAIYDLEGFASWMEKVRAEGLHEKAYFMAGIVANKSVKSMEMTRLVAGMRIPDRFLERMRAAADPAAEGKAIAVELIEAVSRVEGVRGIHIMSVGWEEVVPELAEAAGLLPRPTGDFPRPAAVGL